MQTLARKYAETRGLTVTAIYEDAATSGSSVLNRPGLMQLMADAEAKRFEVLVTENIDRLSLSQADIAALYERLTFLGVKVETLADGAVSEIHVGLKGTMAALFLKDLAQKTKHGQIGRVKAGAASGAAIATAMTSSSATTRKGDCARSTWQRPRSFGASSASMHKGRGRCPLLPPRTPKVLAGREAAAQPLPWSARRGAAMVCSTMSSIVASSSTTASTFVKDPSTGKRIAPENPESEWHRQDVPKLRIVDEELWAAVQSKRAERGGPHLYQRRRPKWLLSGLLRCGCCGGSYSVVNKDYMRCSTLTNSRGCDNRRTVRTGEIAVRILTALQQHLLAPDVVAAAVEAYQQERIRIDQERKRRRNDLTRDLAAVERKTKRVLDIIMNKDNIDRKATSQQLRELEAEQDRLEAKLAIAPSVDAVAVHPQAAERYRAKVAQIHAALKTGDKAGHEAIQLLRELIDHIVVTPTQKPDPVGLQVAGNISVFLICSGTIPEITESMVAGARSGRCSHRPPFSLFA